MTIPIIKFVRQPGSDTEVQLPEYKTAGASGADIRANLPLSSRLQGVNLFPNKPELIPTGLSAQIPQGLEIQIRPRSGLALRNAVSVINSPGTIDSDYRGEIGIIMINLGKQIFCVSHGDRIAQMVVVPIVKASFEMFESLEKSDRASNGFGSTGIS